MKKGSLEFLRRNYLIWLITGFLLIIPILISACSVPGKSIVEKKKSRTILILATTTSLQDSGLLDELIPIFEKLYPYKVKTLAMGTGEALAAGGRGEADVLLVHAPEAEVKFVVDGFGVDRQIVAYNYFVIVGPKNDPAGINSAADVVKAFKLIAQKNALFISRGDESGTHKRELSIWQKAGIEPAGGWYIEAGQGMGETLQLANEKQAYTMADTATFLAMKKRLDLYELIKQNKELLNIYSVIRINPEKFKNLKINVMGAAEFSRFLTSKKGQSVIRNFGRKKFGQALFYLMNDKGEGAKEEGEAW